MSSQVLAETEWRYRAAQHRAKLEPFVTAHLKRRSRREKHPVHDFLFEYYSFRPVHLLKWSPGYDVELRGNTVDFENWKEFSLTQNGRALYSEKFPRHRLEGLLEVLEILESTAQRRAFHGCYGLHEWAMVYRETQVRHAVPLRLATDEIAAFVESQTIRCSHYDAYRLFTPAARPLNLLNPQHEDRAAFEQPGCIHANMDLYKWANKFYPWIGSDLIAAAFSIAREARELDMRAAPYDLRAFGFDPIFIETAEGRQEYQILQRAIAERAAPVRSALVTTYRALLKGVF